jgi:ABC-type lipopolysaccharide export system ATPase subunit
LKVAQFKDEAQKRNVPIEAVRCTFENDFDKGLILGVIAPNGAEAICFEPNEIEGLICELSSGKISLENLAEQLNLTLYHVRLILQYLIKTKRIDGELTYNTYINKITLQKTSLQKAKEHKRNHRLKMRNKQR